MDPEDEEIELQNGVEIEGQEQDIVMQNELIAVGKVNSVNGKTGDVVLTTSDLENDSDYQTGSEVESAISEAVAGKQDKLTAGNNITIENNVISSSDTTYTAGNGLNLSNENEFSIDTTVVATQANLSAEVKNREDADTALQGQIDAISASSDVVDIVGTYAELEAYDTQHLKDNDIIKVLQDETQNNATTYYRWSTHTDTFTLIGQEGPYYTKASADAQFVPQTRTVNSKALSSNITLTASDVSAVATGDVVQNTGSNTAKVISQKATTDALGLKLNISDYVVDNALADSTNPVQNKVLYGLFSSMPSDFFTGPVSVNGNGRDITLTGTMNAKLSDVKMYGDTTQQTYSGKNKLAYTLASLKTANTTGTWTDNVYISNGITYTVNDDLTVTASGSTAVGVPSHFVINSAISLTSGTEYILSGSPSGGSVVSYSMRLYDGGTYMSDTGSGVSFTYGTQTIVRINVAANINIGTKLFSPMIRLASVTDSTYEPYVGGTASPNPDYPQDVNVVTGTQTVGVCGKNLAQVTAANGYNITATLSNGEVNINGTMSAAGNVSMPMSTSLKAGTAYTLSVIGTGTVSGSGYKTIYLNYGEGSKTVGVVSSNTTRTYSFTPTNDVSNATLSFDLANGTAFTNYNVKIQIEKGSATTYEPYQGASYTVRLGSLELCKIGDYQDYIYKSGDDWYVKKETGKVVLNGSETWNGGTSTGSPNFLYAYTSAIDSLAKYGEAQALCDYLTLSTTKLVSASEVTSSLFSVKTTSSDELYKIRIIISNSVASTINNFKTWLSTHNMSVYYVLATATDTQITDTTLIVELEDIHEWMTRYGYQSSVTGNLPMIIKQDALT